MKSRIFSLPFILHTNLIFNTPGFKPPYLILNETLNQQVLQIEMAGYRFFRQAVECVAKVNKKHIEDTHQIQPRFR